LSRSPRSPFTRSSLEQDRSFSLDAKEEAVTLKVVFENLPDGTNYVAQSILDASAKQVQIRTTNSGYNKL